MAIHHEDRHLTILLSGGGTGGHITPLLAVADEIKRLQPDSVVVSVGDRGSNFSHLTESHPAIDRSTSVYAGKFRRYHGESFLKQLIDIRTLLFNIRDLFYFLIGTIQSVFLVKRINPDVVFLKGGFVGVPIGLAAALWRVPIVTHDSDALPGLANRIVGRWAQYHATGMPAEYYKYAPTKTRHVGVLVGQQYSLVTAEEQIRLRQEIELPEQGRLLFVTGGSLGSQRVNDIVLSSAEKLLNKYNDLTIVHQVGKGNGNLYGSFTHDRLKVLEFVDGMYRYSGAADAIVTRAGANTIAEFGIQSKACIVIPSPFLTGGHQLKNAEYLRAAHAALVVDEVAASANPELLEKAVVSILDSPELNQQLASNIHSISLPDASHKLAQLLIEAASK